MRKYIVGRMSPANKKILAKRQLVAKDVRGANAPKKWLEIKGSEKIKDVQGWLMTRSWYEFEGLLDKDSQLLWGYFWLTSMIPRMGGYDQDQMKLLQVVTRLWMLQYEKMFGIGDCPVSYGKYLFRPEWIMKHGLPEYSNECQSDCIGKFLMDDIRRLAQNGNPEEIMVRCYIRDKLLARVKYVVESEHSTEQLEKKTASVTSFILLSKVLSQGTSASMEYANRLSSLMPEWAIFTAEAALRFGFTPMHAPVVSRQLAELEVDSIRFCEKLHPPDFASGRFFNTLRCVLCILLLIRFHSKFVFATYFVRFPFVQL